MPRIGLVSSGGDSPGLNALIHAVVMRGRGRYGDTFVGLFGGWLGLRRAEAIELDERVVEGLALLGGTMLGISSTADVPGDGDVHDIRVALRALDIDALIVIGGNGTLRAAATLHEHGIPVVGVPKSVEHDIGIVDESLGFATVVEVAAEGIHRLRATGDAHHHCTVVEVLGERAGWVALHAGIASDAHAVLVPEFPQTIEQVAAWVRAPMRRGRPPLIVVAEGFRLLEDHRDDEGWGVAPVLARRIAASTGIESSAGVLGGVQRGAAPVAADRVLAARLGRAAVDALHSELWGRGVVSRGSEIHTRALSEVSGHGRTVPQPSYADHSASFG